MARHLPWHSPPHYVSETELYLITAACFEHRPVIGESPQRMAEFEGSLRETCRAHSIETFAWIVLPNHYHILIQTTMVKQLLTAIGQLHGRTSFYWNSEDNKRGRQVWYRAAETAMKSERHFWATVNYVLHNAVRHGYVECIGRGSLESACVRLLSVGVDWKFPRTERSQDDGKAIGVDGGP
ncbi:MAG: transposase, partial [Planctomycetia bacterium]|nr:transposase [Planctomycetia bacterium]